MNCAYIRISEEDVNKVKNFSESIINQIAQIEEYCRKHDIYIDKTYIDEGYSGINFDRPAFEKMLKEMEKNNIETIVTKDFSRLGREYIETSFYITRFFPEHNIRYIAINENYDSIEKSNDAKEMMVGIKGIINDQYIKETSRKIKQVKKQKTKKGCYMGYIAPYGYKRIRAEDGKITLKIDENVCDIVKLIFQKTIDGMSRKDISEFLNSKNIVSPMQYMNITKSRRKKYGDKWTSETVYRIVRNQIYIGNTYKRKSYKKHYRQKTREYIKIRDREIIQNTHVAIIGKEIFEKANSMIKSNEKKDRPKQYIGSLCGLVICGECGKIMSESSRRKENGKIEYFFYCPNGININKKCGNKRRNFSNKLTKIVNKVLMDEIKCTKTDKIVEEAFEYIINKRIKNKKIEILNKEIELQKNKIKELYLQRNINQIQLQEFLKNKNGIYKKTTEIEKKRAMIMKELDEERQKKEIIKHYNNFKGDSNLEKHIADLIKTIICYQDGKIGIALRFTKEK